MASKMAKDAFCLNFHLDGWVHSQVYECKLLSQIGHAFIVRSCCSLEVVLSLSIKVLTASNLSSVSLFYPSQNCS